MAIEAKALSLAEILKWSDTINVPRYQRPYKWERGLIEDIFEDVLMYGGSAGGAGGFMGSIVFCPGANGEDDIVDGQQRLTTLTILAAILARKILNLDPSSELAISAFGLLKSHDGESSKIRHKVHDRIIYEPLVMQDLVGYMQILFGNNSLPESYIRAEAMVKGSKIFNAYEILNELVIEAVAAEMLKSAVSHKEILERLLDSLLNKIIIVRVRANSHTDGIRIFESLNTTGEPLTIDELLKSCYLMYSAKFGKSSEDAAQAYWEDSDTGLYAYLKKDSLRDKFLRTNWLSRHGIVTKSRLYDAYASLLGGLSKGNNEIKLKEFGKEISSSAKLYADMISCSSSWKCLAVLESFGFEIHKVPLMTLANASKYQDTSNLERLMRLAFILEVVLVRMSITGQSTALIERSFCTLSEKIRSGVFSLLPSAFERDVKHYFTGGPGSGSIHRMPDDATFRRAVQSVAISSRGDKWKLFALRIETEMKFPNTVHFKSVPCIDRRKLERHIDFKSDAPSTFVLRQYGFTDGKDYADYCDTIGNFYFFDLQTNRHSKTPFNLISKKFPKKEDIIESSHKLADVANIIWTI